MEGSAVAGVDGVCGITCAADGVGRGRGEGGKGGRHNKRGLSLRARKFVMFAAWLVVNMGLTAVFVVVYDVMASIGSAGMVGL